MFMVALISAHQLLVNFGFGFKTVVNSQKTALLGLCVCVLSGQVWLHEQIVRKLLCRACLQSDLRWVAGGYPPASAVG